MASKSILAALVAAGCSIGASTAAAAVYDTARLVPVGGGAVELEDLARGELGGGSDPNPNGWPFFDTWNIDTSGIAPGEYSFNSAIADAVGSVRFAGIVLNSYDASGARSSILFDLNATGSQGVASGSFTVLPDCPVAHCLWVDILGTQTADDPAAGYAIHMVATLVPVPEPASYGLMALGLAAVGVATRRRRFFS